MRKPMRGLLCLLVAVTLLVSCVPRTVEVPIPPGIVEKIRQAEVVETDNAAQPPAVVMSKEPPGDMTWISPGKVQIGNFYPGARAEWPVQIHNGKDVETIFSVKYRQPDYVGEGYAMPPDEAQDWVIIVDSTPVLAPKETKDILTVLAMPKEGEAPPKWEFWISVMDTGAVKGMTGIHTELCTRWLVNMR